jgi:hypothetical protein
MNRDEVLRMALDAGAFWELSDTPEKDVTFLMRFAERAAAAEREACAKLCDAFQERDVGMQPAECAAAIRARGEK